MASILPSRLPLRWTMFAVLFVPALLVMSWGLSTLLGMDVEYPGLWGRSLSDVLPLMLLAIMLTAVARGGMEEPGWRGMMLPELQRRLSPLSASLIVSLAWSLWHLPLFLNGFYSGDLVAGMIGGGIYRIFIAIFLTWVFNRTGGNLFLMIYLHTSFNMMVNFLPTSDLMLLLLLAIVVGAIVVSDRMYRFHGDEIQHQSSVDTSPASTTP